MSDHARRNTRIVLSVLGNAAAMTLCVCVGYQIVTRFPKMPSTAMIVVSLWAGFALYSVILFVFRHTAMRHGKNERHDPWTSVFEAMERISQGDFSVLLPENNDVHFNGLAKAVNEMAQNLGTLETMRQDFISNVSHEIQSPLTSIGGFAALLQNPDLPQEQRRRYAEIIAAESRRLSSLSDNLLKLSSLDDNKVSLAKTTFRLDKQLEQITLTLEPQWTAKNLTVEADLQNCSVTGDEELLSQAWINLLHNALKFTPTGGQINVSLKADAARAVVRISDTGCGIAPEDQVHIFERFYKADKSRARAQGGNGLGLSLVKKIVELHDGQIHIESEAGAGASFEISLPQPI